jgi:hypothetical protein
MIRQRLAGWTFAWVWRNPRRAARLFHRFAQTEQASSIDLFAAARLSASPTMKAAYLRHALDEARHARLFDRFAESLGRPSSPLHSDVEWLFQSRPEIDFIAFIFEGERRGLAQFEALLAHLRQQPNGAEATQLLVGVMRDERRHAWYSLRHLRTLTGSRAAAVSTLGRVRRHAAWRAWRRAGAAVTGVLYRVLAGLLYVVATPLRLWLSTPVPRWQRP